MVCEGQGIPLNVAVIAANQAEWRQATPVLDGIRVPRRRGRPKQRPTCVLADRGYDVRALRLQLRQRHIRAVIPTYPHGRHSLGDKPLRPRPKRRLRAVDARLYKRRYPVERTFAWLDNYRRLVVRYERSADLFRAFCILAFILICLNRILK